MTMLGNSIARLLAITVMASSLAGCKEALMADDPNRFDVHCEGEIEVEVLSEYIGLREGLDINFPVSKTIETRWLYFSVDLEKMLWCWRPGDLPRGTCHSLEEIISVDLDAIMLDEDYTLHRRAGVMYLGLEELGSLTIPSPGSTRGKYMMVNQRVDGTLDCRKQAFKSFSAGLYF